jgi:hypothetical protein
MESKDRILERAYLSADLGKEVATLVWQLCQCIASGRVRSWRALSCVREV